MEYIQYILSSLNSDLVVALATLITGFGAWFVYLRKKDDDKKNAATIILMEIRNAEKKIEELKKVSDFSGASGETWLLLSNNWQKYNHLFLNDIDRDELEYVNSFYNQCIIIDKQLSQLYQVFSESLSEKNKIIQQKGIELIFKKTFKDPESELFESAIRAASTTDVQFIPDNPNIKIKKALENVRSITTSTCGAKLKKIAKSS